MIQCVAQRLFGRSPNRHCPNRRGTNHRGRRAWRWDPLWQIPSFIIPTLRRSFRKAHLLDYRQKWTILKKKMINEILEKYRWLVQNKELSHTYSIKIFQKVQEKSWRVVFENQISFICIWAIHYFIHRILTAFFDCWDQKLLICSGLKKTGLQLKASLLNCVDCGKV